MPQERLETIVSAKITDFDAKMGKVLGTLDSVEKKSGMASKKLDSVLKSKSAGTGKAVEVVNAKLKQTEQAANRVNKAMSGVDPKKFEAAQAKVSRVNAQLDAQARKLETLNSQYAAYMSKEKTPASLKAMEKEFAAVAQEIASVDAAVAALNSRKQDLQRNMMMSSGSGDTAGAESFRAQIQALEREEQKLLVSTDLLEQKSRSLNAQIASIRMNPAASAEAQALAGRIATADARMESLSHSASAAKIELDSMGRTSPGLDAVNRKLGKIERSTGRTSAAMNRLNRRFLMLLASKVFSAIFRSLHEGFEGAAKKSDQFKRSLDSVVSGGRNIANSIVAAFSPLINVVAPWVTLVAEKIRVLLNRVAMFFAAIAGQKTVMQATQALDEFGSAAETNAAKAQNALAGFDQITKLDTSAGGSGGSGGSKGTDAFEEVAVAETPLTKAVSGILSKISELKGPLEDFYENYIKKFFTWAFDGKGIEGFLDKLKDAIKWFNENPWAVGIVGGLTGLFLAAKVAGGLGAITGLAGAGGAISLSALKVGALAIAGTAVFAGTIYGLDQLFGTDTGASLAKIASNYGGIKGLLNWWITGETTHVDQDTGKTFTVPSETGTSGSWQTANDVWDKTAGGFIYDLFSGRLLNKQNIGKMSDDQLLSEFLKWHEPYKNGTINGDQLRYLEDIATEIKKRNEIESPRVQTSIVRGQSSTNGTTHHENSPGSTKVLAQDVWSLERGYISLEDANRNWEKVNIQALTEVRTETLELTKTSSGLTKTIVASASKTGAGVSGSFSKAGALSRSAINLLGSNSVSVMGGIAYSAQKNAGTYASSWISGSLTAEREIGLSLNRIQQTYQMVKSISDQAAGYMSSALANGSSSGANAVVSTYRNMVNRVTDYLQRMMSNTRIAVISSFSSFASLPAGLRQSLNLSIGSFSVPSVPVLPKFATGGVFSSPTAGIIAEAGREAVLPLDRNTGWMDRLASKIDQGGGGDVYVTVQNVYDGEVVSEKTTRVQRRTSRIHNRPVWA